MHVTVISNRAHIIKSDRLFNITDDTRLLYDLRQAIQCHSRVGWTPVSNKMAGECLKKSFKTYSSEAYRDEVYRPILNNNDNVGDVWADERGRRVDQLCQILESEVVHPEHYWQGDHEVFQIHHQDGNGGVRVREEADHRDFHRMPRTHALAIRCASNCVNAYMKTAWWIGSNNNKINK